MKHVWIIGALLMGVLTFAQDGKKSNFEKQGDMVLGTFYYESGEIQQQGTYNKDGVLHGDWVMYDLNGNKVAQGSYDNGIKSGKWFYWNNQNLTEVDYSANQIANVSVWKKSDAVVGTEK